MFHLVALELLFLQLLQLRHDVQIAHKEVQGCFLEKWLHLVIVDTIEKPLDPSPEQESRYQAEPC